jgi:hypothetical protein
MDEQFVTSLDRREFRWLEITIKVKSLRCHIEFVMLS